MLVRALLALSLLAVAAQGFAASIQGRVTDAGGAGFSGVQVRVYTLTAKGWAVAASVTTDGSGNYYPGVGAGQCATLPGTLWLAGVAAGAWWQVLTSAFAHAEILHLGSNLLALWFLGPPLEQVLGRTRFLAVYGISALGASAAVMWLSAPDSVALGASGAIFGMLGALLILARRFGGNYRLIAAFLGLNILITVIGGGFISWQAHLGGLIGGLASTAALILPPRQRRPVGQLAGLLGLTVVIVGAVAWRAIMLA